jgi:hypothetical protein
MAGAHLRPQLLRRKRVFQPQKHGGWSRMAGEGQSHQALRTARLHQSQNREGENQIDLSGWPCV